MSSQLLFAITTPVGNEEAGANEHSPVTATVLLNHRFSRSDIQSSTSSA